MAQGQIEIEHEVQEPRVEAEQIEAFRKATLSEHIQALPPSFYTLFRRAEYKVMDELGTNWKYLLHAEQEYEYLSEPGLSLVGSSLLVTTRLSELRERKGTQLNTRFVKLESEMKVGDTPVAKSRTHFVIREPAK